MGREAPEVEFSHNFRGLAGRLPPRSLLPWTWLRAYTIIMSNANFVQTHKPGHPLCGGEPRSSCTSSQLEIAVSPPSRLCCALFFCLY